VTEAKRLQRAEHELVDQLQELTTELEQQVAEAQALQEEVEQANSDLVDSLADAEEARRQAEDANAAKSQFLATMSHELRTPLNAIVGYLELLELGLHGPLTDAQREDLARIRRSEETLHRLVEDVLNFARLEAGKVDYRYEEVALDHFLASLEGFIAPRLVRKRLDYRVDSAGAGVTIAVDRDKVEQIMLNLLSNAVKFTDHGRIDVRCAIDDRHVRLAVADTGRGIAPALIESIFEPFAQGERSLTRSVEGTGLGLSISRQLARAMGGDITVESVVGKGSTFVVELPRYRQTE
jgi:signal transduction histidine kinase